MHGLPLTGHVPAPLKGSEMVHPLPATASPTTTSECLMTQLERAHCRPLSTRSTPTVARWFCSTRLRDQWLCAASSRIGRRGHVHRELHRSPILNYVAAARNRSFAMIPRRCDDPAIAQESTTCRPNLSQPVEFGADSGVAALAVQR
jgi:hypothetical protein